MLFNENYIQSKNVSEVKELLSKIKQSHLKTTEISELEKVLGDTILGHIRTTYKLKIGGLIRARKNCGKKAFKNIKSLHYPKWENIPKKYWCLGRCNDCGQSMFYAATETDTAIIEVRPKKGDYITMAEYSPRSANKETTVQVIGVDKLLALDNRYATIFSEHFQRYNDLSADMKEKNNVVNDFLDEQFMQIVNHNESWKYKISIAITNILLQHKDINGLLYPSIAAGKRGANILLKPDYADAHFGITGRDIMEIMDSNSESIFVEKRFAPLNRHHRDPNKIKWRLPLDNEKDKYEIKL